MIRRVLIVFFGVIPATCLVTFLVSVAPMAFLGAAFLLAATGVYSILFAFAWGIGSICGTLSLWIAAFRKPNLAVVAGLISGMVAISPVTYSVVMRTSNFDGISINSVSNAFVFAGPFFVAAALIVEYFVSRRRSC